MADNYVSIKVVADKLLRNPLLNGIPFESILDYTIDFLQIVGVPSNFINKLYAVDYTNYRAALPTDYYECNQLLINDIPARWGSDTFQQFYGTEDTGSGYIGTDPAPSEIPGGATIATVGNYIHAPGKIASAAGLTFTINNSYIFLSKEEGTIKMSYKAIPIDEADGYPLIPDNAVFQRALRLYIEKEHCRILYLNNKLDVNRFNKIEQDYYWAVGAWETDSRKLNLSKAESLFNAFRTLLPRVNEFQNRYRNNSAKERMIIHN